MKTCKILLTFLLVLVSSLVFSQSVPFYVPSSGLVGWWGFNGNAQDGSGNGNHGTVNGATLTTDRFSIASNAYEFNRSSIQSIDVSNTNSLNSITKTTISFWFNVASYGEPGASGHNHFINKSDQNNQQQFIVANNFTGLYFYYGPQSSFFQTSILPPLNLWNNLIVTYNYDGIALNSWCRFYLNGICLDSFPTTSALSITTFDLKFGGYGGANMNMVDGKLDDIGIWNRALTQQEITNLYNSQLPPQTSLCLPTITTTSPSSVGTDSVVIGGNITNDGGSSIVLRGVCYSTSPNPNMGNQRTEDGSGIGSFNTVLRGLNPSTTYYASSYAKNSNGVVVYGNEVSISTNTANGFSSCGGVSDIDGNFYSSVLIGNQCWTQSNLKTNRYQNGDNISTGLNNSQWSSTTSGAYAIYNNNSVNDGLFGKLYNHYAVTDSRGLCPTGWHVPSDAEWTSLVSNLGGTFVAGGLLKSTAIQPIPGGWNMPNTGATNNSGFTALPGGVRADDGYGDVTDHGWWWSSTVLTGPYASFRIMFFSNSRINRGEWGFRFYGMSVRCLKD